MSLVVTVFVPSGIVMAADSRVSIVTQEKKEADGSTVIVENAVVLSDNANKVGALTKVRVGVATFGASIVNNVPIGQVIRRFEKGLSAEESVKEVAEKLLSYFEEHFPEVSAGFHVCGYRREGEEDVPYVFFCHTRSDPVPKRWNVNEKGEIVYGLIRSGDTHIVDRLIDPQALPVFAAMPLQDAIDYAVFLIRTTIEALRFEPRFPSVGGPIDVLVINPREMKFVRRKELQVL